MTGKARRVTERPNAKDVAGACYEALAVVGIRYRYGVGSLAISDDFLGWIGLNVGTHRNFVRVNPNIGVHCVPVMSLVAEVFGERYRSGELPTISYPLGEACPRVLEFVFKSSSHIPAETQRLAATMGECGIPYMKQLADYDTLVSRLTSRVDALGSAPEYLAVTLYLQGRASAAMELLDRLISKFGGKNIETYVERLATLKDRLSTRSKK